MVKSQLELYLEKLDETTTPQTVFSQSTTNSDTTSKSVVEGRYNSSVTIGFRFVLNILLSGTLKDFNCCFKYFRNGRFKVSHGKVDNSISPLNHNVYDVLRIITFLYLLSYYVRKRTVNDTLQFGYVWRCFEIFIILTLNPIICAFVLSWMLNFTKTKYVASYQSFLCLLGVIKRIQLVSLGRSLTHPLPPLFSLENTMMEQFGDDRVLVCREVRNTLKDVSLNLLESTHSALMVIDYDATQRSDEIDCSLINTKRYCDMHENNLFGNFAAQARAAVDSSGSDIPSSRYLQSLAHLAFVQSAEAFGSRIDDLLADRLTALAEIISSGIGNDLTCLVWGEWLGLSRSLCLLLLECPLLCVRLICAIDSCQRQLKMISSGLQTQGTLSNGLFDSTTKYNGESDSTINTDDDAHRFSTAYLDLRVRLVRLRGKYEEASHRLWLCDQALSSPSASQCLLPDCMITSREGRKSSQTFDGVVKALAGLHATSEFDVAKHLLSSHTHSSDSMSAALDHFHGTLPLLTDWRDLDQQLRTLFRGCESGVFSATKQVAASTAAGKHCLSGDGHGNERLCLSADAFRDALLSNGGASSLADTLEHSSDAGGDARRVLLSGAFSVEDGVVEVFAATVPKQRDELRTKRGGKQSDTQRRLQADREREAMQAKSLMMELSTALVRKEGVGSLERVRTIVCKSDDDGEGYRRDEHQSEGADEEAVRLEIQQEMTTTRKMTIQSEVEVVSPHVEERYPSSGDERFATPVPSTTTHSITTMAELRSILAMQNRPGGGEEECFSCSDDEE